MASQAPQIMACAQCDALQHVKRCDDDAKAVCFRCGGDVQRGRNLHADALSALALTGLVLFVVGNFSPLLVLSAQGNSTASSFFQSTMALWNQDYRLIAVTVFLTAVVMPGAILASTLFLTGCVSLHQRALIGRLPPSFEPVLRLAQAVREWSMIEVFMAGALVSFFKLTSQNRATVVAGPALYSCTLLVLLLIVLTSWFHPRDLWDEIATSEELRA
jgi:paraquat-inducible protein A